MELIDDTTQMVICLVLEGDPVEIMDIRNDEVTITWRLPPDVANQTTKQRLVVSVIRSSHHGSKSSVSVNVGPEQRSYTFLSLVGNTTYRASVETFAEDVSLWYASNVFTTSLASLSWLAAPSDIVVVDKTNTSLEISWTAPVIHETGHSAVINQHLMNVYEFVPSANLLVKKFSLNIPVPKTTYTIGRLTPGSVYNITLQSRFSEMETKMLRWTAGDKRLDLLAMPSYVKGLVSVQLPISYVKLAYGRMAVFFMRMMTAFRRLASK
ncbi:unnamed protein product [Heligmosomoides polygyrus]|uniref:Fibronectin type-III domain-containing protein n=1 Tax=Heligmosomoides polygyrus TaxID=6339 RepID=A0A3P7XJR5_HELPZ|nr:unnamed protein product [Heligmosomoides polygyrus]